MNSAADKQRVLIVDDTPENIHILMGILKEQYVVSVAINGERALKIAAMDPAPDLILLDIMMPDMNGYEVCAKLKADEKTVNIPVLFVTALTSEENEAEGLALGALDYIAKPFNPALVKARVKNHLELKKYSDHLEEMVKEKTYELMLTSKAREAMGLFTVGILFMLAIYAIAQRSLTRATEIWGTSTPTTVVIATVFSIFIFVLIKKTGYPLDTFGLTFANWRKSVKESLKYTFPVLLLIVFLKWGMQNLGLGFTHQPLFAIASTFINNKNSQVQYLLFVTYILFCPLQEFIVRGGMQSAFQNFLPEFPQKTWVSIIISNLLFSMAHSFISLTFVLLTFIPGLLWGWLYDRQKNLIGVTLSHMLVGVWALVIVGL